MSIRTESAAMRLCRWLGMERLAWSLRRLHCPVGRGARVLEVGSGGNPYPRADVLLDAYEETRERQWTPLKADRPTVLGFVENLPFRDQAFDFVIASHVLEHSAEPERFLAELQRVARAGYIEVPDAFVERLQPYWDHRLEITAREGALVIWKKPAAVVDPLLVDLYRPRAEALVARTVLARHPFAFHVRHHWEGRIDHVVVNPEVDAHWPSPGRAGGATQAAPLRQRVRGWIRDLLRHLTHQLAKSRRPLELHSLLRCPSCQGLHLVPSGDQLACADCGKAYPVRNGIPVMQASPPRGG